MVATYFQSSKERRVVSFSLLERVCLERVYYFPFFLECAVLNNSQPLALSAENDMYRYNAGRAMLQVGASVWSGEKQHQPNNTPDKQLLAGYN